MFFLLRARPDCPVHNFFQRRILSFLLRLDHKQFPCLPIRKDHLAAVEAGIRVSIETVKAHPRPMLLRLHRRLALNRARIGSKTTTTTIKA